MDADGWLGRRPHGRVPGFTGGSKGFSTAAHTMGQARGASRRDGVSVFHAVRRSRLREAPGRAAGTPEGVSAARPCARYWALSPALRITCFQRASSARM